MTYDESLRFLDGLLDAGKRPPRRSREVTLTRTRRLLFRLGRPDTNLRTVLVAGTKGKGSTAAMLAAIEQAAGRAVGLYAKPHLVDYRERIRVDGALVRPDELAALVSEVRPHIEAGGQDPDGMPTYFEASVALAVLYFHQRAVDLAVLEVGLGGRLDATNVCDPVLSVITPISLDHVEVLGGTLRAIAREKAGILRPGGPAVVAPQPPEAAAALRDAAGEVGARLIDVGSRTRWQEGSMCQQGQTLRLAIGETDYGEITLPLLGRHQVVNAATAVTAADALIGVASLPVSADEVRRGLFGLRWPGRVEIVRHRPVVVVDVAHNPASMEALRAALQELWPGGQVVLVFGMVSTHDAHATAKVIVPMASVVVATTPRHVHALPAHRLAEIARGLGASVEVVPEPVDAVERGLALAGSDGIVCITGSFYLAGEARASLTGEAAPGEGRGAQQPPNAVTGVATQPSPVRSS